MKTLFYKTVKPIIKCIFYVLFRPTVIGIENIPKENSLVLAGNHTKWLDPIMLIAVVKRPVFFLAKQELFKGPLGIIIKAMNCIPVNRKIHDKNALSEAKKVLSENNVIGIFPEGTVNKTKDLVLPFKIGAVKMSNDTNSTLVPFAITGKYKLFRKSIEIEFLKPRKISKDLDKENSKLMKEISNKLEVKR